MDLGTRGLTTVESLDEWGGTLSPFTISEADRAAVFLQSNDVVIVKDLDTRGFKRIGYDIPASFRSNFVFAPPTAITCAPQGGSIIAMFRDGIAKYSFDGHFDAMTSDEDVVRLTVDPEKNLAIVHMVKRRWWLVDIPTFTITKSITEHAELLRDPNYRAQSRGMWNLDSGWVDGAIRYERGEEAGSYYKVPGVGTERAPNWDFLNYRNGQYYLYRYYSRPVLGSSRWQSEDRYFKTINLFERYTRHHKTIRPEEAVHQW